MRSPGMDWSEKMSEPPDEQSKPPPLGHRDRGSSNARPTRMTRHSYELTIQMPRVWRRMRHPNRIGTATVPECEREEFTGEPKRHALHTRRTPSSRSLDELAYQGICASVHAPSGSLRVARRRRQQRCLIDRGRRRRCRRSAFLNVECPQARTQPFLRIRGELAQRARLAFGRPMRAFVH